MSKIQVVAGGFYKTKNDIIFCCYNVVENLAKCISTHIGYKWDYTLDGKFLSWKDSDCDFVEQVDPSKAT